MLDLLSYPRGILVTFVGALWTAVMSFVIVFVAGVIRHRRVVDFFIDYIWSHPLLLMSGVKVERRGAENVAGTPKGCLLLFNHSSHFDIPVLYAYFPRSFRFGAKIELFKIPVFGWAMKLCGVLPIDRRNRNKVMKIYQDAIARIDRGECFALAPEGTRQPAPKLGSFKRGPFEFAINAGMDIVPVVLAGTYAVLPRSAVWVNQGRWTRKVIMQILPRVSAADYALEQVDDLLNRVHEQMAVAHDRLYAELGQQGVAPP
ncbi:MAG: 1-acyl-sn-glycerol-3-phosphate acyltransferase [Bdellovibrionales bacterium]|nr:1-acyl-sn-glycerol-3-phosphate acyltransferase [Bdellovibrionales bacterium]